MNRLRGIVRSVFPPPRRPLRWTDAWPLVAFLTVFIGICVALDLFDVLLFSRFAPFALLVAAPWFWWMHVGGYAGLSRGRAAVALLSRLTLLGLFIVLLTEPRAVRTDHRLTVVFAVDHSSSIAQPQKDKALAFVARGSTVGKPEQDEAGLIVFGRNAAVELPPSVTLPFEGYVNVNVNIDTDGTNIAKALSLAAAMLPADRQGRLTLLTDGVANDGELTAVLEDLKSKKIAVDVLGIGYDYDNEVWLERLELPRFVKIGENYEAAVILSSVEAGEGKLVLQENGRIVYSEQVSFEAGKNRFAMPIYFRDPGFYEYEATIELPEGADGWKQNNVAISFLHLKGRGRVRVVVDPAGDERDYVDVVRAMRQAERDVEVTNAYDFPRNAMALLEDDAIVFVNVGRDAFDEQQIKAAHDAVYDQGSGFLMVGGENSFAPGGWHQSDVERLLPVSMDISQKKRLPKGALAIILHTCEFPEGNTWAKRITKQAIKVLSPQDEVGVLDYSYTRGGEGWVFPMTPASRYDELVLKINAATPGDMPSFEPTMRVGLAGLQASDAAAKHMIIISDGDPSPPPPSLLAQFQAHKITVSTVTVFPHGGQTQVMQMIADVTGGRHYQPTDPNTLPSIFIKEAKTIRRVAIQNKTFVPKLDTYSQVIKGISTVPELKGYVLTSAKPRSTVILKGPEEEELDPILSTWRYGAGVTAAFTSDLSPNWGENWVQWSQYEPFVQQLMTEISRVGRESNLRIRTFPAEGQGIIFVEDYSPTESFMEVRAQVQFPDGQQQTVALRQTSPRRYEGTFPLAGQGRYQVMALGVGDGPEQRTHGGFVLPYSQEFLRFRSNPIVLAEIAEKTGGKLLTGEETAEQVFERRGAPRQTSQPIADWLLMMLACMIPLDIGLRRVQLDWQVIKGWFTLGRVRHEDATTSKLLSVKKQVAATMRSDDKPLRVSPRPVRTTTAGQRPAVTVTAAMPAESKPAAEEPATTTSRLLQAKRRASERSRKPEGEK